MPKGGKRPGAGRPKGSRNRRTEEQAKAVEQDGLTPLEFLTQVYRDETQELERRVDAAKAAAPYVHPRLSNVDANVQQSGSVRIVVDTGIERS